MRQFIVTKPSFLLRTMLSSFCVFGWIYFLCPSSFAATLYISPVGANSATCGTNASPCATFDYVFSSRMNGGDTLIVKNGTYKQRLSNPPSGTAGAYTIVKAENDGLAIISDGTSGYNPVVNIAGSYIQLEGFKVVSTASGGLLQGSLSLPNGSHHNKILRSGFVVTPCTTSACENRASVDVSGHDNLLEDCWTWGGGRYKFVVFGGDNLTDGVNNILRRCVVRHDREYSGGYNPQAAFANYQAKNTLFQNCMVIDSDQLSYYDGTSGVWKGPFWLEKGQKGGFVKIEGSIALNFGQRDTACIIDNSTMSDSVEMTRAGNISVENTVCSGGGGGFWGYADGHANSRVLSLDHSFMGNINPSYVNTSTYADTGSGFTGGVANTTQSANAISTNNIFYSVVQGSGSGSGTGLYNVKGSNNYNSFYSNYANYAGGAKVGANDITSVNPLATSLLYPVRIETGSPLKGAGSGGSDIGPTILKRIGVSGTLYGEEGYNTVTSENLWPWPNEARIKADMSAYPTNWPSNGMPIPLRGFTTGTSIDGSPQTLTKYIWETFGNQIPADIYNTTPDSIAPTVTAFTVPTTSSSLVVSVLSFVANDNLAVTGYLITESATPPSSSAPGWTGSAPVTYTATTSGTHTLYPWAKDSAGNVSAVFGSPRTVTITVVQVVQDTTPPSITAFTLPSTSSSLTFTVTSLAASDSLGVTGYLITESPTPPLPAATGWSSSVPTTITASGTGIKTFYAWAKDIAGNLSASLSSTVSISIAQTGKIYYVRTDGSNNATGLNNTNDPASGAWLTLQKAANTVVAGDTVYVADGTYAGFMIQKAGTSANRIIFRAIGTGAKITTRNPTTTDGINIESWTGTPSDYISVIGFEVYNQPRMGIRAIGGTGITIENCKVHNNSDTGIFSGDTPNIQVLNNTVYTNGNSNMQHNIYISNSLSDNPVIRGNIVYSARAGNGIQLNGDWESGGDGYIDNAIIENNIVYSNVGKGLSLISIRYGRIQNNIIYSNGGAGGIHIVEQLGRNFSINNVVANNTMDEPSVAAVRINAGNTGNIVFNNIAIGSNGIVFEGSGNSQSNNLSSTNGTGVFIDYVGHNYRLVEGSSAIDSGLSIYGSTTPPSKDLLGTVRPQYNLFDIGAYEFAIIGGPPKVPSGLGVTNIIK